MNQESVHDAGNDAKEKGDEEPVIHVQDKRFWARDKGEGEEAADAAPKKPTYVEELETKLAEKEQRLADTLKQYKEALDEFENAKARLRRDIGKEIEAGKRSILTDLLDVVDNLERAVGSQGAKDVQSLLNGVTMVRDQFLAKLSGLGVTRFEALQAPFDPSRCEAVSIVPVADKAQDGLVVGVVRDCYLINGETLRHGMVAVGKGPEDKAQGETSAPEG